MGFVKLIMLVTRYITLTVFFLLMNSNFTAQAQPPQAVHFDGERAMADLVKQVEAGPRIPASPGLAFTRDLIKTTLTGAGFEVHSQNFTTSSPLLRIPVDGENIFGIYPKGSKVKAIISAHYDTRPFADMDPDPSRRRDPVPGANDGASGVAILLELARCIAANPPSHGVALVFFDVEDHGGPGDSMGFCLGSRHFAQNLPAEVQGFSYGVNLDMVGDADLQLPMEGYSLNKAPKLTFDLWRTGSQLYPQAWLKTRGASIYDDHMPFLAQNFDYIDVIDFNYQPWHTTSDTPDKCSAKSLEMVGHTVLSFIQN